MTVTHALNLPRVLMIAPTGEGVGGMICLCNDLLRELENQQLVDLRVIDSAQRYRSYWDHSILSRLRGGLPAAFKLIFQLWMILFRFKPESVQIWSSGSLGIYRDLVLVGISRLMGSRVYVWFHHGRIPQLAGQNSFQWRLMRWVIRLTSGVQVLDRTSKVVLDLSFPPGKIRQFSNAISCSWAEDIRGRVISSKSVNTVTKLVFVGMILPTKGVSELVEACSQIQGINFDLEFVGPVEPAMKEHLVRIASIRNDGNWLSFLGALSRVESVERIAVADILVLPSYTEGFPIVILEAMACGVAIVATNVGAIPEMLMGEGGESTGLIVPPKDIESLRLALQRLLANPTERMQLAQAANRICLANYSMENLARQCTELWAGHQR